MSIVNNWEESLVIGARVPRSKPELDKVDPAYWKPQTVLEKTPGTKVELDPTGRSPNEPGAKVDQGKVRTWLMMSGFANALEEVARVTTKGAEKYTPGGWATVPNGADRYMEAFARHMISLGKGEEYDLGEGGTGCLHKAQAIWNLLASLELELRAK
jgi:Domain of unknown function (DUF5664)